MTFFKELRQAAFLSSILLVLCGVAYPVALTGTSALLAADKANGSLMYFNATPIGSALVGQTFTSPNFLKGRPSAVNYNIWTPETKNSGSYTGVASGSGNMGASNPALLERIEADLAKFLAANPQASTAEIPADLFTASGSGLDPHISPAAARIQLPALAAHTGLPMDTLEAMLSQNTIPKLWGIFGEDVVHVLKMNMAISTAMQKQ